MSWILIHKKSGPTSMSMTRAVKKLLHVKKAGHAGTLDPLATGVLPIAIGQTTRLIPFMMEGVKKYTFTVRWGISTDTDDSLGEVIQTSEVIPSYHQILSVLPLFQGAIKQRPPVYSAVKVQGRASYEWARAYQQSCLLEEKSLYIENLDLTTHRETESDFVVTCSSGTYVRSLARDIALSLETLGHIIRLERIQTGKFLLKDCYPLDFLEKIDHKGREALLRPAQEGLDDIPVFRVTQEEVQHLWRGLPIQSADGFANRIISCLCENQLVALAKVNEAGIAFPFRCFCDVQF